MDLDKWIAVNGWGPYYRGSHPSLYIEEDEAAVDSENGLP